MVPRNLTVKEALFVNKLYLACLRPFTTPRCAVLTFHGITLGR